MTSASPPTQAVERQADFVKALKELDRGERAHLRRNAGKSLSEAGGALGLFYRILPRGVPEWQHERYFLVATLFPLAASSDDRNLGATLARIRNPNNAAGLDRRLAALLDSDIGQLPFRLRQLIRLIHANRGGVNWQKLLSDVLDWDRTPDRRVQKHWAMNYFGSA